MVTIVYYIDTALYLGEKRHPREVMKSLGIIYQKAIPQSLGDQWWFLMAENIPDPIPSFLGVLHMNPLEMVGFGLSKNEAERLLAIDNTINLSNPKDR